MNALAAKDGMSFVMLASLSTAGIIASAPAISGYDNPPRKPLFGRVVKAVKWLADQPRRAAVVQELSALSDHELSDIGLTRGDVPRIFDPAFIAQRAELQG